MDINELNLQLSGVRIVKFEFGKDETILLQGIRDGQILEFTLTSRDCGLYIDKVDKLN